MTPEMVELRCAVLRAVRRFFEERGFLEVDTPVRIAAPAPEPFIDCPRVASGGFLRASPELQMKKLLADRIAPIFQIGPCFRDGENGSRHSTEFTMLEWYRLDATCEDLKCDLVEMLHDLASAFPQTAFAPLGEIASYSVRDAYRRFAGWDPFDPEQWAANSALFDEHMVNKVEPVLARHNAVFLEGYPPPCASLAKIEHGVAKRWEFYLSGMELANCFTELTDPDEQRCRFEQARDERRHLGEDDYPLDEEFLSRIGEVGSAAGAALGFDRLLMALSGARNIRSVHFTDA